MLQLYAGLYLCVLHQFQLQNGCILAHKITSTVYGCMGKPTINFFPLIHMHLRDSCAKCGRIMQKMGGGVAADCPQFTKGPLAFKPGIHL